MVPAAAGLADHRANRNRIFFRRDAVLPYTSKMTAKLSKDLVAALHATGDSGLEVVDPETQRTYVIVVSNVHRQAMDALRRQQDRDAIAEGLAQMEAGQGKPLDEALSSIRTRLGLRETP